MPKRDCLTCSKVFSRPPSGLGKYCSRPCYDAARPSRFDLKAWAERNRLDQNAKKSAWRLANRAKRLLIQKAWRDRNKARIAERSRLRRQIYQTGATVGDVRQVLEAAKGLCTYCGLPTDRLELDHVDPVAWGADHSIGNMIPACRTCNASKSDRDVAEWLFERHGVPGLARAIVMLEQRENFRTAKRKQA